MTVEEYKARALVMKALASPVRLQIVDELSRGERCMCELQPLFAMNKSTLSRTPTTRSVARHRSHSTAPQPE